MGGKPDTVLNRPFTEAERATAAQWAPMGWKMARKWHKRMGGTSDVGEFFSMAMLGILRGVRTHDPSRSKMTTHMQNSAEWSIRATKSREMQAWKRRDERGYREVALDAMVRRPADARTTQAREVGGWSEEAMGEALHPRIREIVMLRARGLTLEQVGDCIGLSRQAVHNALRQAEPLVREAIHANCAA